MRRARRRRRWIPSRRGPGGGGASAGGGGILGPFQDHAEELFAAHGVPVLPGEVADTAEEARAAAARIGGAVVVKAQVKTGGRGKAGGVKLATGPDEGAQKATAIL